MARTFFCAWPALLVGAGTAFVHPIIGVITAACMFGLGWQVTARPRGNREA